MSASRASFRARDAARCIRCAAHRHEAAGGDRVTVCGKVRTDQLDPLLRLDTRRQLVEDVVLIPAQIHRRDSATKPVRSGDSVGGADAGDDFGLELSDQRSELLDAVLHWGPRQYRVRFARRCQMVATRSPPAPLRRKVESFVCWATS